jgi:hypothetical protein
VKIEHSDPELREDMPVKKPDAAEERAVLECRTSGEQDTSLLNGSPARAGAKWEGEELVIETWVQLGGREMHFCDYWYLSPDGQTLFMEHRNDDLAGQLTVLDRVDKAQL